MTRFASLIARFSIPLLVMAFGVGAASAATITISPVPTGGKVTSNRGGLNCGTGGAVCTSADIASGLSVTLTATPDAGYSFVQWSGSMGTISTNPLTFTMPPTAVTGAATFVGTAPTITSANATTFVAGQAGTFTVTATGTPAPTFAVTAGSLPAGVALAANGTLSGTPATGTGGIHTVVIRASNGVAPNAFQTFTLTMNEAVVITGPGATTFWEQAPGTFTMTATGFPAPSWFEVTSGVLPSGVTLASGGTLAGTPAPGTAGDYPVMITAANGVTTADSKPFTLTVRPALYISRLMGRVGLDVSPDGFPARATRVRLAHGVATDVAGNVFVSETSGALVRRIDAVTGRVTTVAGTGEVGFAGDGGPAIHARLSGPTSLAVDAVGNLYVEDRENFRIRRIDAATGVITTVAGNGVLGCGIDDVPATTQPLGLETPLAVDAAGNLHLSEYSCQRVRKLSGGVLTTIAGTGEGGYSGDGGPATAAKLSGPFGIHFNAAGDIFIAQLDGCAVRKVSGGTITTVAGIGACGDLVEGAVATATPVFRPSSVTTDPDGNLYIGSWGVARVDAVTGIATMPVGKGTNDPWDNGLAVSVINYEAYRVAWRANGRLVMAYPWNDVLTEVGPAVPLAFTSAATTTFHQQSPGRFFVNADGFPRPNFAISAGTLPAGVTLSEEGVLSGVPAAGTAGSYPVTIAAQNGFTAPAQQSFTLVVGPPIVIGTVAGNGASGFTGDGGLATSTTINGAKGVAVDAAGNLFVADTGNHRVRRVDAATGVITTFAGTGAGGFGGDGGLATSALLNGPTFLAFDAGGNLHIADTGNNRIRKIETATGLISTVAGNGTTTYVENVVATTAGLGSPTGIAFGAGGSLYLSETGSHRIRKVSGGNLTTVAGTGFPGYSGNGGIATSAMLSSPGGLAVTASGEVLIADTMNHVIRRVSGGYISTLAGTGAAGSTGDDAIAILATLDQPVAVAVDAAGMIFVSTQGRVRRIEGAMGLITTWAGNGTAGGAGDGGIPTAASVAPWQVTPAPNGDLFVADPGNHRVRRIGLPDTAIAITSALSTTFTLNAAGSFTMRASGFPLPTFMAVGTLPTGVTLSPAGLLSGTPTQSGVFAFTVVASNSLSTPAGVTFTLTVRASQTITFGTAPTVTVGGTGTVSATASSGLAVAYSTTSTACSVHATSGLVTGLATGTCTIAADQAGNAAYFAAPQVTQAFTVAAANAPRLGNISTRGMVQTGNDVMIGGFIIGGPVPKKVLVTARGPSLTPYGVTGALANPVLDIYSGQTVIASNDDFGTAPNLAEIDATGVAPTDALESAILLTLDPGAYTAIVSGLGGTSGVGIVEVFEVDHPEVPLINISTRGQVQTSDRVMIGGFIIFGDTPKTVLVTARGPSLAPYGIANPLANPVLQLYSGQTMIASNDDWLTNANAAAILATGVAPSNSLESAILLTLNPGAYTAIVSGVGGTSGVGIVEVFAQ